MCSMNDLNANFTTLKMIGGGKFLKKLWYCVGG